MKRDRHWLALFTIRPRIAVHAHTWTPTSTVVSRPGTGPGRLSAFSLTRLPAKSRYSRNNPIRFSDPGGTQTQAPDEFKPGTANYDVGTRTDAQLFRFIKAMSPEQRGAFRARTTGAFLNRVQAFLNKYELGTMVTLPEVQIEGDAPEIILPEPPGLSALWRSAPGF